MKTRSKSFTLIELLIVIAIIAILVSFATVSYSSAQKKSRDSKRKADLKAVQNAFEQYYADNNGLYPATCSVSAIYLPQGIPSDPKTGSPYGQSCTTNSYCFCATLEAGSGGNATAESCPPSWGIGGFFCVASIQ